MNPDGTYRVFIDDYPVITGFSYSDPIDNAGDYIRISALSDNTSGSTDMHTKIRVDDLKIYDGAYRALSHEKQLNYEPQDGCIVMSAKGKILAPESITVSQLKEGINAQNAAITVYDADFTAPVSDSTPVPEGAKVSVQAENSPRIDVFEVTNDEAEKAVGNVDFEDGTDPVSVLDKNAEYESAELADGGFGKENKALVLKAENVPVGTKTNARLSLTDPYMPHISGMIPNVRKSTVTMELSVMADGDFSEIDFNARPLFYKFAGDNADAVYNGFSAYLKINPDGTIDGNDEIMINKKEWTRVAFEIDPETMFVNIYVNGVKARENVPICNGYSSENSVFLGMTWFSPVLNVPEIAADGGNTARSAALAIDDLELYYGPYSSDADDEAKIVSTSLDMYGNNLHINGDTDVSSFVLDSDFGTAQVAVYCDGTFKEKLTAYEYMSAGNVVVLTSRSGNTYSYYNVLETEPAEIKTYVDDIESNLINGPCTIKAEYSAQHNTGTLILAIYNAAGELTKVITDDSAPYSASYKIEDDSGVTAKAMVWNRMENARPLAGAKVFMNAQNIE